MTKPLNPSLSQTGRLIVLVVAFLGWLCAGILMSVTQLTGAAAAVDLLSQAGEIDKARFQALKKQERQSPDEQNQLKEWNTLVSRWFAWFQCSFLFGAATGGLVFGWLGDRIGRARGMAVSILTYSALAAAASQAQSLPQLLGLWFLACMGVGGMWPNGVALVSEAWANLSRPAVAGVIGTAANFGLFLMAWIAGLKKITPEDWRWALLVASIPLVLGAFALFAVPESPRWLAARNEPGDRPAHPGIGEVFRPPFLQITLVGILLATVPLIGGWGTANWMIPWADSVAGSTNPGLKAEIQQARSLTGIVGSLLGGWIASLVGRRLTFFLVSLASLLFAQYTFWFLVPTDPWFLVWVGALGFVSGIYFGWLPLFLPELFPTRVRSTGAGVSFNFGRILTAVTIFTTGTLTALFAGNYPRIGRVTSLIFLLGMVGILFAPDVNRKQLQD